jgi:DNA-binding MarR family transcriptional regulator
VGLEGTQYTVLAHVYISGPITLTKLADLMSVDRTTLGRNLKPLEKKGFISIKVGDDRRAKLISITDHGNQVLSRAHPIWKETHDQIKKLLGGENWSNTIENLSILTNKLRET